MNCISAQTLQHFLEHRVLPDTQKTVADLRLRVTVAEMKRAAQQVVRRRAFDAVSCFGGGHDADHAAVVADHQIAVAQHAAARREQRHFLARTQLGAQPAFLAQLVRQHEFIVDLVGVADFGVERQHTDQNRK